MKIAIFRKGEISRVFRILFCLGGFLVFSNCSIIQSSRSVNKSLSSKSEYRYDPKKQKNDEIFREIEKNRSLWITRNVSNHDFFIERIVEGMGGDFKLKLEVQNHRPQPLKNPDKYANPGRIEEHNSIEKLFDHLERLVREEKFKVTVIFNKEYGYPQEISWSGPNNSNGWGTVKIKRFEIVK